MTGLIIMGPPGSGKGTQAKQLAKQFDIATISTGNLLRTNIKEGTEIGHQAEDFIQAGKIVPDSLVDALVDDCFHNGHFEHGFLLDGYPRNIAQVKTLDGVLNRYGSALDLVLHLHLDEEIVVSRILKRAEIEGRDDDTEPVIRHRLEVYEKQTKPVLEEYKSRNLVADIAADGTVSEVFAGLCEAVKAVTS